MERIEKAFETVRREYFVPADLIDEAEYDAALPIGYGQTISQPSTVKQMLAWLEAKKGQTVLDVGSGSGWTTALLAYLVGESGTIYATERIPELLEFGKNNTESFFSDRKNKNNENGDYAKIEFYKAGKTIGLPENGPFDRILVSAAADTIPCELIDQLKIGGKIVIPVHDEILEITKISDTKIKTIIHPGFVFVPLIQSGIS